MSKMKKRLGVTKRERERGSERKNKINRKNVKKKEGHREIKLS